MALLDSYSKPKFLPPRKNTLGEQRFLVQTCICDDFRMYEFKIRQCMRGRSHDWTDCPFSHPGEKARRRDPRKFHYSSSPCPDFRKGSCKRGDLCEYAHGVFECWLHPARYRTQACKDGELCKRRVCFFAHSPQQLRHIQPSSVDTDFSPSEAMVMESTCEFSDEEVMGSPASRACNVTKLQGKFSSPPAPLRTLPSQLCSTGMVNLNSEVLSTMDLPYNSFSMTQSISPCHSSYLVEQQAMRFMFHEGYNGGSPCYEIGGLRASPRNFQIEDSSIFQMDASIEMKNEPSTCTLSRGLNTPLGFPPSSISTSTSRSFYSSPPFSPQCFSTPKDEEIDSFFSHDPCNFNLHLDVTTPKKSTMVTYMIPLEAAESSSQQLDHNLYNIQVRNTNLGSSSGFPSTSWKNIQHLACGGKGPKFVDISRTTLDCSYDMLSKVHGGIESTFENTLPDVGWVHELVM